MVSGYKSSLLCDEKIGQVKNLHLLASVKKWQLAAEALRELSNFFEMSALPD